MNQLKYFYFVASPGGFTKAAQALNIHQPGVSKAVQQLEESLGVILLERHKRKIVLTKVGREIFEKCERIFADCAEISSIAEGEKSECSGPLTFCAAEVIASHVTPTVNAQMLKRFPDVRPVTFCGTSSQLLEKITEGAFEFGLFFHIPDIGTEFELKKIGLVPYELVILRSRAMDKAVRSAFIGSREVDDSKGRKFPTLEKWRRVEPSAQIRISSNSLTAHKQMVREGLGISILPRFLVAEELKNKTFQRLLPDEKFEFPMKTVLRKYKILSRNAQTWLEYLDEWLVKI